jgi:phage N-6-adenine-methyltransferase
MSAESPNDQWTTPDWLVALLAERVGGRFDLDAAARAENRKAPEFYSLDRSGLDHPWHGHVLCNPPFSKLKLFAAKAIAEVKAGHALDVCFFSLSDTSTQYWRDLEEYGAERVRIGGRFGFEPPAGVKESVIRATVVPWVIRPRMTVAQAIERFSQPELRKGLRSV